MVAHEEQGRGVWLSVYFSTGVFLPDPRQGRVCSVRQFCRDVEEAQSRIRYFRENYLARKLSLREPKPPSYVAGTMIKQCPIPETPKKRKRR